jgi:phage antirepressor YoqD-like protein
VKYGDKEVDIKKLAKELNVKETKLLNFINENKKHFDIGYKNITKTHSKLFIFKVEK